MRVAIRRHRELIILRTLLQAPIANIRPELAGAVLWLDKSARTGALQLALLGDDILDGEALGSVVAGGEGERGVRVALVRGGDGGGAVAAGEGGEFEVRVGQALFGHCARAHLDRGQRGVLLRVLLLALVEKDVREAADGKAGGLEEEVEGGFFSFVVHGDGEGGEGEDASFDHCGDGFFC